MATEFKRMRQLSGTQAEFTSANTVLLEGEIAIATDVHGYKVGPGAFNSLPWFWIKEPTGPITYARQNGAWVPNYTGIKWTDLVDTPNGYADQGDKFIKVKSNETGLEFSLGGSGGSESFLGLTDTPSDYSGFGGRLVTVNQAEDGLEFADYQLTSDASMVGMVASFPVANVPDGWLILDGSNFDSGEYPDLYAYLGTTSLPDWRDRFVKGTPNGGTPGATGGEKTHVLSTAELPVHAHGAGTLAAASAGSHSHKVYYGDTASGGSTQNAVSGSPGDGNRNTSSDGAHGHSITGSTANAGSGNAHNNEPQFVSVVFAIRAVPLASAPGGGGGLDPTAVHWKGAWAPGAYITNDFVRDGSWSMIANKPTTERPAPQPVGALQESLPDAPAFVTDDHIGHVQTGSRFVFTETGLVTGVEVWVPEDVGDIEYRLIAVNLLDPDNPFGATIPATGLTPGQWNVVTGPTLRVPIQVGNEYLVLLDAVNSAVTTNWEYSWQFTGNSNQAPASTECNHTANQGTLKLHKTSLSGDAAVSLGEVVTGSRITLTDPLNLNRYFEYSVFSILDQGTYLQFGVNLLQTGPAGGPDFPAPTTVSAVIPVHDLTEYVEEVGGNLAHPWVTMEGTKWFDGVEQPGNAANAYGVRIEFQQAYVSPDWDLVSYTGAVQSGGGGDASTFLELTDTPPVYTGAANKIVTVKADETGLEFKDSTGGGGSSVVTGPTPPANPANGDLWYRTTVTPGLYVWYDDGDSSQWVQSNGGGSAPQLPIGYVWTSFSATNPAIVLGYGTWVATAEGRVPVGVGNAGGRTWNARDEAGADQAQLSVSNLPAHNHAAGTLVAASNGAHSHDTGYANDVTASGGAGNTLRGTGTVRTKTDGAHTHSITGSTASQGADAPFDIIQPSVALYMFERIA